MTIENFCALLARNNAGEEEAIDGYFQLLSSIKEMGLPVELYRDIAEIISDEMNHNEVLNRWMVSLSQIKPNET